MMLTRRVSGVAAALLTTATLALPTPANGQSNTVKEEFTANAVNISNVGRTGASQIELTINRYTTDATRDQLVATFKEQGADALLKALQNERPIGNIRAPGSLSYDLRYARELPGEEGGRRIILATDRPIGFIEAQNSPRSLDYPFTLIELRLDKDGRGEGKLSIATKLTLNDNVLVIENYADQPVMLTDVRKH